MLSYAHPNLQTRTAEKQWRPGRAQRARPQWGLRSGRGRGQPRASSSLPPSDRADAARSLTSATTIHTGADRLRCFRTPTPACRLGLPRSRGGQVGRDQHWPVLDRGQSPFSTVTRDQALPRPVADAASLRSAARACLRRVPLDRRLRLLGLRAGNLVAGDGRGESLAHLKVGQVPSLFQDLDFEGG